MTSVFDYEIGKPLGNGKFSNVYLGRTKGDHTTTVALKVLHKEQIERAKLVHQLETEIEIHSRLSGHHPYIVRLLQHFSDNDRAYLVLEYVDGGDLYQIMQRLEPDKCFTEQRARRYVVQVAVAVDYCHRSGVIHRDVKMDNVLLDTSTNCAKLTDFGWSTTDQRSTHLCGTLDYLPPEMVNNIEYDHRVDNWCLGVMTFEMLAGKAPFVTATYRDTYRMIATATYEPPEHFSDDVCAFIDGLLQLDADDRMSLFDAIRHKWLIV